MPGAVLSNTGDNFGKARRSPLVNSMPQLSTNARGGADPMRAMMRSEEHTSELQSLMRISYAVFCLKKKRHEYHLHLVLLFSLSRLLIHITLFLFIFYSSF